MTSLVFPGQGSQFVGMARDFYDNFSIVRETFDEIETYSKINLKNIIFENESNLIDITQYTQISIFCVSISIFNLLKKEYFNNNFSINFSLGHSLGEYSALVSSNVFTIKECSKLLKIRGELMQNAYATNESGMAAIIGLNCSEVEKIIKENNIEIEVANDNSPLQVVISGTSDSLLKSKNIILNNGAKKFVELNVSAAFHSKIMKKAEQEMKLFLDKVTFKKPLNPIISNFTAKPSSDVKVLFDNLCQQMSNKVRWIESIKNLENLKETNIIEIGPGKILSGLIKRISNSFTVTNINSINDLDILANMLENNEQ